MFLGLRLLVCFHDQRKGTERLCLETIQWEFDLLLASKKQGLNRYKGPYMVACREIYFCVPRMIESVLSPLLPGYPKMDHNFDNLSYNPQRFLGAHGHPLEFWGVGVLFVGLPNTIGE